jgi:predicted AAA+ superfamily ATPase
MFERNAIKNLERWAAKQNRKPLILRGSRQVGKTTLVESFARQFENYLYLNFEKNPSAISLFENEKEIDDLLADVFLFCNREKRQGKTLLFIDEIQNSSRAITRLRYFYEAKNADLYVIAAGSLLETMLNKEVAFPVGRVEYMALRPCTFNEFLRAVGEKQLEKALLKQAIPEALHGKTMQIFNTFTLIGGMPEIVADYAENKDFVSLGEIYENLLASYRDDVEKYARNETMKHVISYILQEGWKFAAERITLGAFAGSPYKARETGEAFRTLQKTMLLELCYPTTDLLVPVTKDLNRSPKLLWFDCGLVNYAAKVQKEVFGASDILDSWRGNIAEQIVAQELLALDNKISSQRNFWVRDKNSSNAEVDFVLQYDNQVIPIEVKSGHNAHLRSLHVFMENVHHATAFRIWSNPFSVDNVKTANGKEITLYNLPFYYVSQIEEFLKQK